jgi:endonuclease III
MATTMNKQRLLSQLLSQLQKGDSDPETRPVLQQFIFGLCRENATPEQAERAYRNLSERFFDWNEVRVSSLRELEDAFAGLSGAESRAQRLVSFLQEVFETTFSFDLEDLHKKGVKVASKQLMRYQAANDYVGSWVVQRTLGGHAIPLDESTLRCVRRLGLIDAQQEDLEGIRSSLEHLLPKAKGPAFTDAISRVAEGYCHEERPRCSSCPLASECNYAQEHGVADAVPETRSHRPKSR